MRVLLIDPPMAWRDGPTEPAHPVPIGLALLAAVLRDAGHDVALHLAGTDPWDGRDTARALDAALSAATPDVVGVGCSTATWETARRVARHVKAARPDALVVLGGPHPTLLARDVLEEPAVDVVVRGEAEKTLPALLDGERGRGERDRALSGVPGLVWRGADGVVRETASAPFIGDLDALPLPAYDTLLWGDRAHRAAFAGVLTARGCPFDCLYCAASALGGRRLRRRAPARVAEEVARIVGEQGVDYLFFQDSVFTVSRSHLDGVLSAIEAAVGRVPFTCQTRTDCVDEAIAARLAAGGCHRVMMGVESGVPQTLERIRKRADLEEPRRVARLLQGAGIAVTGFFMIGFPWESEADMTQTVDYALDLGLDAVHLFSATPLPGSDLAVETGLRALPEGHDFRGPSLNLTALPDATYAALFERLAARVTEGNLARLRR